MVEDSIGSMSDEGLATCVRVAMAKAGISNIAIGEALGRSVTSVVAYRNQGTRDKLVLGAIAKECGMSLAEMLSLTGSPVEKV